MSFQLRSFNTGLAVISLASSLLGFYFRCRIVLSLFQSPPSSYIPIPLSIVIEPYHHHYQSLTTPNDVTIPIPFRNKMFNNNTIQLSHTRDLFSSSLRFRHSAPPMFSGYPIWTSVYPDRILLPCQPTFVYARDITPKPTHEKIIGGCNNLEKASLIHMHNAYFVIFESNSTTCI